MQGNFSYHNPTKLYFGDESLNFLKDELKNFGPVVLLNYGSGSRTLAGSLDACPSRLLLCCRIDGLLSSRHEARPAQIRALCQERLECQR